MRPWFILRSRVRSLLFRGRREQDLRDELQLHLDREIDRLQATGLSRDEARQLALRAFGGVEQLKEECRDARGTMRWDAFVRDLRQGTRRLVRDWRFTAAAVLILGLAIGANTAIFSLVNAAMFRDQAVADPDRLVNIYQNDRSGRPLVVTTYAAYNDIAGATTVLAGTTAASLPDPQRYLHDGAVRTATVAYTTASYPDVLGLRPSLGRWFDRTEERIGMPLVGVLGFDIWTRAFHADRSIVGQVVRVEGVPVTIVGIGPSNHRAIIDVGVSTDLWLPITAVPVISKNPAARQDVAIHVPLFVKGRLRTGVTLAQAQSAMGAIARRLEAAYPDDYRRSGEFALGPGLTVIPSTEVRIHPQADVPFMALASLVLAIVGLVLAIACSNLATLLLVRGAARAREISVRLALGATSRHLVRLLLAESVLLALAGGAVGCLLAWWGVRALQRVDLPITIDLTLDYRVLAFAMVLSLVTGVTFGLAPALKAAKADLLDALRQEGLQPIEHRRLTLKNALMVMQVAISVLLLGGTSVFVQMFEATRTHTVGFAVNGVAMLETDPRFAGYPEAAARTAYDGLLRRVRAIPGVQSATLLRGLPMQPNGVAIVTDSASGQQGPELRAAMIDAGPGFFETLRIPLLYGRTFDERDRPDTPRVAVVTDRMARTYFGTVNAVGRRFRSPSDPNSWSEVIGVVPDTGTGDFDNDVVDPIAPIFYRSFAQAGAAPTTVVARTSGEASALVGAMQRELRAVDVTLPVITARTMAQQLAQSEATPVLVASFLGALGGLGLLLASIGLYAVIAFAVARRSREIGIRMALGAQRQQVVASIARGVAGLVGIGTGIGLGLSVLVMLALRASDGSSDIGIGNLSVYRPSIDPLALLAIALVTCLVGVAAAFVPARRATRLDPLVALRHE